MFERVFNLNESMHVSDTVTDMTDYLYGLILNDLKKHRKLISDDERFAFKKGSFDVDFSEFLKEAPAINVRYCIYFVENDSEYNLALRKLKLFGGITDYKKKYISLYLGMFGDREGPDFKSIIQHELNHLFQTYNGQEKNDEYYDKLTDLFKNGNYQDRIIAYALYLAYNTEISSFASQYYRYLKQNNIPRVISTEDYQVIDCPENPYYDFYMVFSKIDEMKIDEENLLEKFGMTEDRLYSLLNKAEDRYILKMRKVWSKYKYEIERQDEMFSVNHMSRILEHYKNNITEKDTDDIDY